MADFLGQQMGNYRLTRLIGHGGFADVYLGEHIRLSMKAAIKVLHAYLAEEHIEAFQREARMIAEMEHPHIIRVMDFDIQYGRPFLVLHYAPNGSLAQRHPRGSRLSGDLIDDYLKQISSALYYAHNLKLIHRDIKPENMLLGTRGEVLLSDFGIAAISHSTESINKQSPMGTLEYMAPEQIQGRSRVASDQYALATTVYQWLTGTPPFRGSSTEIIAQHLAANAPSLRTRIPNIPDDIDQIVLKALSKNPHDRFENVEKFAQAFSQALTRPRSASYRPIAPANPTPTKEVNFVSSPSDFHKSSSLAKIAEKQSISSPAPPPNTLDKLPVKPALPAKLTPYLPIKQKKPRRKFRAWQIGIISIVILGLVISTIFIGISRYRTLSFNTNYQTIISTPPSASYSLTNQDSASEQAWSAQDNSTFCQINRNGYIVQNGATCIGENGLNDQRTQNLLIRIDINVVSGSCGLIAVSVRYSEVELCADGSMRSDQADGSYQTFSTAATVGPNVTNTLSLEILHTNQNQTLLIAFVQGQYVFDRTDTISSTQISPTILLGADQSSTVLFQNLKIWKIGSAT